MYTKCLIQWQDDLSEEEVIIKSNHEVLNREDDDIFFYGLSPLELTLARENGALIKGEWKVLEILGVSPTL